MGVRQVVFLALCVTASLAQAGPLDAAAAPSAPRAATWLLGPGATPMQPSLSSAQQMMSVGPGAWSMHSRVGDAGATSTVLFAGSGQKAANFSGGPSVMPVVNAAAPSGDTFTNGPADTSQLGNGGVTGGPSQPPPFTDVALGGGPDDKVKAPPASEMVDVIVNLPVVTAPLDVVAPSAVPEPATSMLLLAGLLGAGVFSRRRK